MSNKRVSLFHLIEYVDQIVKSENDNNILVGENDTEDAVSYNILTKSNIKFIDDVEYDNLNFGEKSNIFGYQENCKDIFDPFISNIYRHGTIKRYKDNNISLLYSIFMCLDKKFCTKSKSTQVKWLDAAINKIVDDIKKEDLEKNYNDADIIKELTTFSNNKIVLRFLSDYFNINIFLINVIEDKMFAIYGEEQFNIFKNSIFLSFYDEQFEFLSYDDKKIWEYNDPPFKKIIKVSKKKISIMDIGETKEFELGTEDISKYIKLDKDIPEDSAINMVNTIEIEESDCQDNYIDDIDTYDNYVDPNVFKPSEKQDATPTRIIANNKMKLGELQNIAKEYNISIFSGKTLAGKPKKKTKAMLIKDINNL